MDQLNFLVGFKSSLNINALLAANNFLNNRSKKIDNKYIFKLSY